MLAIEEQFYFVWPILLSVLPSKLYPYSFGAVILFSLIFRYLNDKNSIYLEHHTLSCMGDLAVGGLGAWFAQQAGFVSRIKNMNRIWDFCFISNCGNYLFLQRSAHAIY